MTAMNLSFFDVRGTVNIFEDASPCVAYNDGCSRYERYQRLIKATNPSDLTQATLRNLVFPNLDGEVEDLEEEDENEDEDEKDKEDYGKDISLQQALEKEHEAYNQVKYSEEEDEEEDGQDMNLQQALEQEHGAYDLVEYSVEEDDHEYYWQTRF
jgi:hypothetical protein